MLLATVALLLTPPKPPVENPGQMFVVGKKGRSLMPLERTSVAADVAGMGARVTVRQTFVNPSAGPIEALYTFPLPHDAAVDSMRIKIGDRVIDGTIMRRAAAKAVYEAAKANGQTAALLDQETDNVFAQSVANVMPGRKIEVEISYVQILKFEDGEFEFSYPMVVAPRFMGKGSPAGVSTNTLPPGVRSGANVDLAVTLRGGAPIQEFHSVLHQVRAAKIDGETVRIELAKRDEIPNHDFVLRYRTAAKEVQAATFTTWDPKTGGHFALVLAPPPAPDPSLRSPKESIFVIDQSGSQSGFPIDKSKELTLALMRTMGPADTFNVMGFSNEVEPLWPGPRPNTPENRAEAQGFVKGLQANGGTELEKAIVASLSPSVDPERTRIVLFNTDGLAGQESTILSNVQRFRGSSRLFTFGIGNSVNRSLIDAMSLEGRGASEVVTLAEGAEAAKNRFAKRLETPLLMNVKAAFDGDSVTGVTPAYLPDVFSAKPVVVYGRYTVPGRTRMTLTGVSGGRPWSRVVELDLPRTKADGSSVASLWARARLAEMKSAGYAARALGGKSETEEAMTKLALDYRIMSEHTSFVAVDRSVSNPDKVSRTVSVPTEMPDGMTFGGGMTKLKAMPSLSAPAGAPVSGGAVRRRIGGSGGVGGGGAQNGFSTGAGGSLQDERLVGGAFEPYDPAEGRLATKETPKGRRLVAIGKGLFDAKGEVDVRVSVGAVSQARLESLRKAGLRVGSHDGATLVFGTATAKALRELAKLDFVERIAPLRMKG